MSDITDTVCVFGSKERSGKEEEEQGKTAADEVGIVMGDNNNKYGQ